MCFYSTYPDENIALATPFQEYHKSPEYHMRRLIILTYIAKRGITLNTTLYQLDGLAWYIQAKYLPFPTQWVDWERPVSSRRLDLSRHYVATQINERYWINRMVIFMYLYPSKLALHYISNETVRLPFRTAGMLDSALAALIRTFYNHDQMWNGTRASANGSSPLPFDKDRTIKNLL